MKTKIEIIVQDGNELAEEFGVRLQKFIDAVYQNKDKEIRSLICFPTSSSNGRQTMTIQWLEEKRVDDIMIDGLVKEIITQLKASAVGQTIKDYQFTTINEIIGKIIKKFHNLQ